MPEFFIYTAILDDYDYPPDIVNVDPKIQYICFTNSNFFSAYHYPWKIVPISNYFTEKKLTIGYIKSNSHILFRNNVVSVWINANLKHILLDAEYIANRMQKVAVATPPHLINPASTGKSEIFNESKDENPEAAHRYLAQIKDEGFQGDQGLSATMLIMRDHRNKQVAEANALWWHILASGVHQEELSFNYSLWKFGLPWEKIDIDGGVPNSFFTKVEHKNLHLRQSSMETSALNECGLKLAMPNVPANYPKNISYILENWNSNELSTIRRLNTIINQADTHGKVEGNYCYFHNTILTPYTPPDPRRSWKREYLRRAVHGRKNGLEIGFNGGHSATILLSAEPLFSLTSIDLGEHQYSKICAEFLSNKYGDRFQCVWGDSKLKLPDIDARNLEFVHIDGGHDAKSALFDLDWFATKAPVGCRLVIDDIYAPHIQKFANIMTERGILSREDPEIQSSGENAMFVKRKTQKLKN